MAEMMQLLLIPICSVANHLGGQSTTIPDPRITCRVIAIPAAFELAAYFTGANLWQGLFVLAGMAMWATPAWAQGFMALPYVTGTLPADRRGTGLLDSLCNLLMGVNPLTTLTVRQCRIWGVLFMTMRGGYLYPLFIALGAFYNPWAYVIGLGCFLQGAVYGLAQEVIYAEFVMGAIIGAMLAGVLL